MFNSPTRHAQVLLRLFLGYHIMFLVAQRTQFSTHYIPFVIDTQPSLFTCFGEFIKYFFWGWGGSITNSSQNFKLKKHSRDQSNSIKSQAYMTVVFPAPLGPRSAVIWPLWKVRLRSLTAAFWPSTCSLVRDSSTTPMVVAPSVQGTFQPWGSVWGRVAEQAGCWI